MIHIDCFIKEGCDACKIAVKNITNVINEINCDISLNIKNVTASDTSINKFPTIVISKKYLSHESKELSRLEGSFPSDYIKTVINKLIKE